MRRAAFILALVATLLAAPRLGARDATPASTPTSSGLVLRLRLDALAPDNVATIGITRTTYAAGGGLRLLAGSGPAVFVVETGALTLRPDAAAIPSIVVRAGAAAGDSLGAETSLTAGDAVLLPAGGALEVRNDGTEPAAALDLLAAADARTDQEQGVTRAVMASHTETLPPTPVELTLARAMIAAGARYPIPPAPIVTVLATLVRSQTFLLSGQGINRGKTPMDVYVLTIAPDVAHGQSSR